MMTYNLSIIVTSASVFFNVLGSLQIPPKPPPTITMMSAIIFSFFFIPFSCLSLFLGHFCNYWLFLVFAQKFKVIIGRDVPIIFV